MPEPFLRIPPFPGHRAPPLSWQEGGPITEAEAASLAEALRRARVGGSFWAAQPGLPEGRDLLLAPANEAQLVEMLGSLTAQEQAGVVVVAPRHWKIAVQAPRLSEPCDPWHLVGQVAECLSGADDELALVAALSGKPVRLFGTGRFAGCTDNPAAMLSRALAGQGFVDPFSGQPWDPMQAIAQLGEWRSLIDANRNVAAIYGVAAWKRVTADAMLWDGTGPVRHARALPAGAGPGTRVLAWKSRTAPALLARLEAAGCQVGELEDGFIRSVGLGANCVPPLSVFADFSGIYFDPAVPSDLEVILEQAEIGPVLCGRAAAIRQELIRSAISKYGQGGHAIARPDGPQRRVLVTGQVEDDRSIISGGRGTTNLELLARTRALEPEAWIIYKPHPDVEAGHRKGHVPEAEALRFADEVQREAPIIPLIDAVDALHVITSLAGFEALLRGKSVTTHGVPFYAGWGLTHDLAAIPARRTRHRSLDELVAAALLLYPRYLDPVTRLPCPAEVLVGRMAAGQAQVSSPLVTLREWQGRVQAMLRRVGVMR